MNEQNKGILFRTMFCMRFFDADWNELPALAVVTPNVQVLAIHLREWRQSQIDRLLSEGSGISEHPIACVACIEVTVE